MPAARAGAAPALLPPGGAVERPGISRDPGERTIANDLPAKLRCRGLARMTAPCSRRRAVAGESSVQGPSAEMARDPLRVGQPLVRTTSLIVAVTPSITPIGVPRIHLASLARALCIAASPSRKQNAFSIESSFSILSSAVSVTSTGDSDFFA
jgi:hypothetical protein